MKKVVHRGREKNIPYSIDIFNKILPLDTVEVKVFQNRNNKQFNLPVLKKNTSPEIIQNILGNSDVIGLKFKITDVILRKNRITRKSSTIYPQELKGGNRK